MEKWIKESDVIAIICKDCYADCPGTCAEVENIKALPTIQPEVLACGNGELVAQPEPQWIPVSERLPEPRIDVWVNSDLGQMVGYYDEMVELWYGRDYLELIVNAWMPLPTPYTK